MTTTKQPWALAIIYVVASLAIEAALMIIGHLKVPRDNPILAPVVLTVPPVVAVWLCGYRRPGELATAAVLLSALTLAVTLLFGRLTGVSTGMLEPIINRSLAGFLAGVITNRLVAKATLVLLQVAGLDEIQQKAQR